MVTEVFIFDTKGLEVIFDDDVYIHATSIASSFNKRPETWLKTQSTQDYISALNSVLPDKELVIVNNGGLTPGTWIHPKLAVAFARWLNPHFGVWCDMKIEALLQDGYVGATDDIQRELEEISPKLKAIQTYVRKTGKIRMPKLLEFLASMEEQAHTLRDYKVAISGITSSASADDREGLYNKLIKGIYKAYEDDMISRRTQEDALQILNANLIKLLRRRQTELIKKLSIPVKNEDISKYLDEIQNLKDKLQELEGELEDPRPIKFQLRTNHIIDDTNNAVRNINDSGYVVLFNGLLIQDNDKVAKKYPDWKGDSLGNFTGAGLWENDGYYWVRLSMSKPPYADLAKIELYQSPSDENVFVGTDNVKRHFATFNNVTGSFIVYRKK